MIELDPDAVAASLWNQYRATLSATVSAKSHYFTMSQESGTTKVALQRAFADWQRLNARRRALAQRLGKLESRSES